MDENIQNDIRRLLKTFGVKADQAIQAYLESRPELSGVKVRLVLEDLTPYDQQPVDPLHLFVEGEVKRGS